MPIAELTNIDDDADYKVKMKLPHKWGRYLFSVLYSYRMKGKVVKEIPPEKIADISAA